MADLAVTKEAYIPLAPLGGGKLVAHVCNAAVAATSGDLLTKLKDGALVAGFGVPSATAGSVTVALTVASGKVAITGLTSGEDTSFLLIGEIT